MKCGLIDGDQQVNVQGCVLCYQSMRKLSKQIQGTAERAFTLNVAEPRGSWTSQN